MTHKSWAWKNNSTRAQPPQNSTRPSIIDSTRPDVETPRAAAASASDKAQVMVAGRPPRRGVASPEGQAQRRATRPQQERLRRGLGGVEGLFRSRVRVRVGFARFGSEANGYSPCVRVLLRCSWAIQQELIEIVVLVLDWLRFRFSKP